MSIWKGVSKLEALLNLSIMLRREDMRKKVLLILALSAVLFVSLTVGTLSSYTSVSSFGISIYSDLDKAKN